MHICLHFEIIKRLKLIIQIKWHQNTNKEHMRFDHEFQPHIQVNQIKGTYAFEDFLTSDQTSCLMQENNVARVNEKSSSTNLEKNMKFP